MESASASSVFVALQRPRWVASLTVLALVAIAAAVLMHRHVRGRLHLSQQHVAIPAAEVRAERGHCHVFDLHTTWMSSNERPSPARLLEDGRDLGPANAMHEAIRDQGQGRFSLWSGVIYFAASDNSDPATNGHRYEVVWPTPVPSAVVLGLKGLAILLGVLAVLAWSGLWVRRGQPWLHRRLTANAERLQGSLAGRAHLHWRVCLAVAAVAVLVRLVDITVLFANPGDHITGAIIMGTPFSDAKGWDGLGESVMSGYGLTGGWSARRPFLAIVIGALYTWTGPMPGAVIAMNVALCGWTAALVCRIGQRVFHPLVGLAAGLAFAFDPISIEYTSYVLTETLGTFLFVLSMRYMVAGLAEDRASSCWWAGVMFALSNLTRTLTLPAAPLLALAALIAGKKKGGTWRRGMVLATVFCVGIGVPLGTWIARQKVVHDMTTISDNTASGLYGAAAPKYGTWTSAIDREADEAGIPGDIKSRYEWFMQRFREELRADPWFYIDNVRRSVRDALMTLAAVPPAVPWLLALVAMAAWLARLPLMAARSRTLLPWLAVLLGIGFALFELPTAGMLWLATFGWLAAAVQRHDRLSLVLLGTFLCTVVAVGLFALGGDPRLLLMVSWMVPLALAYAVIAAISIAARLVGGRNVAAWPAPVADLGVTPRWAKFVVRAVATLLALSLLVVAYRTFVSPMPRPPQLSHPTVAASLAAVQRLEERIPGSVAPAELVDPSTWYHQIDGPDATPGHGKLIVANLRLSRHRFLLPADLTVNHYSRMFIVRTYDRTFTYADNCLLCEGGSGPGAIMFSSPMPDTSQRDVFAIGRAHVDRAYVYEENYFEVLAWAPLVDGSTFDLAQLQVTNDPAHIELVRALRH